MAFIETAAPATEKPASPKAKLPAPVASILTVEAAHDLPALERHVGAWEDLSAAAIEPNIFYEPWMLLPALRQFGAGQALEVIFIYRTTSQSRELCGVFPLERRPHYKGLPIAVLGLWKHLHCVLCTPLLRDGHALETLQAFLEWARSDRRGVALVDFDGTTADGPFQQVLTDHLYRQGGLAYVYETWTRALLRTRHTGEEFLSEALSTGYRKEMRRLRRRLSELGRLESRLLDSAADVPRWLEWFLQLEASGWKGRAGAASAIGLHADQRAYFQESTQEAFGRGRLQMLGLFIDDRPIAITFNILSGAGGFHCKIAYDEALGRFSPGVQVELDLIAEAHRRGELRWLDSCAVPDHPMINRLWPDRRIMQKLVLSTGRWQGDLTVSLLPVLRWLKRTVRGRRPFGAPACD